MTAILKASLPIILLIVFMSHSLAGKASSDAEKKPGLPAGTIGHQQDEDSGKFYRLPLSTRGLSKLGHSQAEDAVESQSEQPYKEIKAIKDRQPDIKEHN